MENKNATDWICPMSSHCGCVGNHTLAPICYDEWLAYLEKKNPKKTEVENEKRAAADSQF